MRWAARAGIVGPILFTVVFVAQQWARRDSYDWVAEPVSNLEAGPHGWVQQANFVVFGLFMAAAFPIEQDAQGLAYDPGFHFVAGVTFFLSSALALLVVSRSLPRDGL
jgi:hypothetical membrane protein